MSDFPEMKYVDQGAVELPVEASPLEFLYAVYRDPRAPLPVRIKCAIEAAPFVHPKLTVSANFTAGFGTRMEQLMRKQGIPSVIDASRDREGDPT
jgi:hypothetical protein